MFYDSASGVNVVHKAQNSTIKSGVKDGTLDPC